MTRTNRSTSPRAIIKDRSEPRTGLDSSMRKGGAGAHNWGSINEELRFEKEALGDEAQELEEEEAGAGTSVSPAAREKAEKAARKRSPSVSEEEREQALNVRKNALKSGKEIDLGTIARTSRAVSSSPPKNVPIVTAAASTEVLPERAVSP
ncbi:hypothetical protein EWM64_g10353 [Hericium alpestre]|uniref:Hyaluronan/mRNA-binding protein domain-containing protein n=1 Tax=Hericium alpestre TaxID=135208 RepID=A0A4Y9ZHK9_9AGAM|nr:hypothetical protein EWM64_g10353 [Hericium alpestre]